MFVFSLVMHGLIFVGVMLGVIYVDGNEKATNSLLLFVGFISFIALSISSSVFQTD